MVHERTLQVAEIAKLDKDVAETKQAIEEAEEQRKKENADYLKKKSALELGLANLEKAIKVAPILPCKVIFGTYAVCIDVQRR